MTRIRDPRPLCRPLCPECGSRSTVRVRVAGRSSIACFQCMNLEALLADKLGVARPDDDRSAETFAADFVQLMTPDRWEAVKFCAKNRFRPRCSLGRRELTQEQLEALYRLRPGKEPRDV